MKTLEERMAFLISEREILAPWVGWYDMDALRKWLDAELGDWRRLESWVDGARVIPRSPVLHVVSRNTEHAAFQSLFRATLIGCESRVKLPSTGLPEFEKWARKMGSVTISKTLQEDWKMSEVAVIYGGAEAIDFMRGWVSPQTRVIEHGPKLSAAFVFKNRVGLAASLAQDVMRYGQRGCLSVQAIYFEGNIPDFCQELAEEMAAYVRQNGAVKLSLSEAGAIRNARELARFQMVNGEGIQLLESPDAMDWTIVYDAHGCELRSGAVGGFVRIHAMPGELSRETLGREVDYISTAVVEPLSAHERLAGISPPRICATGKGQEPGIFWHPDGEMPLAGLVRWRDLG